MTRHRAANTLRLHRSTPCTVQFWASATAARDFDTMRECLQFLAEGGDDEALPDVHVHAPDGELALNGPDLDHLIAVARRSAI